MQTPKLHVVGSDGQSRSESRSYQLNISNPRQAAAYGASGLVAGYVAVKGVEIAGAMAIAAGLKGMRWFKAKWSGEEEEAEEVAPTTARSRSRSKSSQGAELGLASNE